mgnify:FL=1
MVPKFALALNGINKRVVKASQGPVQAINILCKKQGQVGKRPYIGIFKNKDMVIPYKIILKGIDIGNQGQGDYQQ